MSPKPKFKPEISRVELNPEQAVLTCDCYNHGRVSHGPFGRGTVGDQANCRWNLAKTSEHGLTFNPFTETPGSMYWYGHIGLS